MIKYVIICDRCGRDVGAAESLFELNRLLKKTRIKTVSQDDLVVDQYLCEICKRFVQHRHNFDSNSYDVSGGKN